MQEIAEVSSVRDLCPHANDPGSEISCHLNQSGLDNNSCEWEPEWAGIPPRTCLLIDGAQLKQRKLNPGWRRRLMLCGDTWLHLVQDACPGGGAPPPPPPPPTDRRDRVSDRHHFTSCRRLSVLGSGRQRGQGFALISSSLVPLPSKLPSSDGQKKGS